MYQQPNESSSSISSASSIGEADRREQLALRRRQAVTRLTGPNGLAAATTPSGLAALHATLSQSLLPKASYLDEASLLAALGQQQTNGRPRAASSDTSEDSVVNAVKHGFGEDESIVAAEDGGPSQWPYWSEVRDELASAIDAHSFVWTRPQWPVCSLRCQNGGVRIV